MKWLGLWSGIIHSLIAGVLVCGGIWLRVLIWNLVLLFYWRLLLHTSPSCTDCTYLCRRSTRGETACTAKTLVYSFIISLSITYLSVIYLSVIYLSVIYISTYDLSIYDLSIYDLSMHLHSSIRASELPKILLK